MAACSPRTRHHVPAPGSHRRWKPDVTADFSGVVLSQVAPDRVSVSNGRARGKSPTLKASIGYVAGFVGEGEMSYAGRNALARARLAGEALIAVAASASVTKL